MLAAIVCTADLVTYTPTPTLRWDAAQYAQGYNVYYRQNGDTAWTLGLHLPCDVESLQCVGDSLDVPIQRIPVSEGILYDFAVKAFNIYGESQNFSTPISLCPPHIWVKPEHYQ